MREKFMFFQNFKETADKLPDDLRLKFYDAMTNYVFNGVEPDDSVVNALITAIKPSLDKVDERGGFREGAGRKSNEFKNNQNNSNEIKANQNNQSFQETETETENINNKKEMVKEKVSKFGELGYVRLTDEQYTTLKEKYPNIDDAIEVLDTYLGTTGSKHRNKNHYGYFKSNSWVWERVNERETQRKPIESVSSGYFPSGVSNEKIETIVEQRKNDEEERHKNIEEANKWLDFIKAKGYPNVLSLISAGKDVYDRIKSEYKQQAVGF